MVIQIIDCVYAHIKKINL